MNTRTDSTTNPTTNEATTYQPDASHPLASPVFADPVSYLASFGIDSELVDVPGLPAAA